MEQLFNFFSNGQQRRTALDELFAGLERYVPPNLRPAVETVAEMNPVQGQMNAMTAGGVVFDPDQTAEARRRAAVDMGVEMALALTPAALAARGYLTPVQGVMEGLLGGSPAQQQIAEDAGKLAADASGLARSAIQLDPDMLGEIFQRAGETEDLSAARVMLGSDYFEPPREGGGRAKDPAMFTPFSLSAKQKDAPYNWRVEGETLETNTPPTLITPSQDQGKTLFFAAGDRTAGDVEINKLGDVTLKRPVRLYAGPEYMDTGDVWASHKGVMKPKQNVLLPFVEAGGEAKLSYAPMGERSGDFAKHQGELFSEYMYSVDMPKDTVKSIDDELAKIVRKYQEKTLASENKKRAKKGLPEIQEAANMPIPSVSSDAFRDWFSTQSPEQIRKPFMQRIDQADMKALEGAPDVGLIRFGTTNPDLVDVESFSGGYRFGTPDVQRGLLSADHPSYDTKYAAAEGTTSGTYGTSIPWTIMARDTALPRLRDAALQSGYRFGSNTPPRDYTLPSDQRVFTMNPNTSQLMDQQFVEESSTFMDLEKQLGRPAAIEYAQGLLMNYLRNY